MVDSDGCLSALVRRFSTSWNGSHAIRQVRFGVIRACFPEGSIFNSTTTRILSLEIYSGLQWRDRFILINVSANAYNYFWDLHMVFYALTHIRQSFPDCVGSWIKNSIRYYSQYYTKAQRSMALKEAEIAQEVESCSSTHTIRLKRPSESLYNYSNKLLIKYFEGQSTHIMLTWYLSAYYSYRES